MSYQQKELSPELSAYLAAEYEVALEIFKVSNPLVRLGSKNFFACAEFLQGEKVSEELWSRNVFLAALAQCAAAGTLDRDRTAAEKDEIQRKRNLENEARDRTAGNAGTPRGHMSDDEQERLELEARENLINNLTAVKKRLNAETNSPERQMELTANDCLYALTGDGKTPLTQEGVAQWLKVWPADLCRVVRRSHDDLRTRMDVVLAGNPDPMTGINQ
jgi:hypothetical protein